MSRVPRAPLILASLLLLGADTPRTPTIATLPVPGPDALADIAREITDVAVAIDPSLASGSGLFDDSVRVPSYAPKTVKKLTKRLDADLATLRALPWRTWTVDEQIDVRWLYALAETMRHQLVVERMYERRPAQWLEPVASDLIALQSYAPDRPELQDQVYAKIPAMIAEMRTVATKVTRRDRETAVTLCDALAEMAAARNQTAASSALALYGEDLQKLEPSEEFAVVGADAYAWRMAHYQLLPWTPEQLKARAQSELERVDAALAALPPREPPAEPTPEQIALAESLDSRKQLAMYDAIEEANRAATIAGGWVTVGPQVGPIRARETPPAMIPLTGDGGSMNPPPTYSSSNIGYWNVEHFHADAPLEDKVQTVVHAQAFLDNGMGPYSAHEGFPGHHLQLSIARLNPDPIRSILPDCPQNEGWGLYAEGVFAEHGGLGQSVGAQASVLGSYRTRIRRVLYDVPIETGEWTLQQAADWKYAKEGAGVDEDILRSINWPGQLVCYFAGKSEIVALREEVRAKQGAAFDEKAFHDAFLAEGSIPIALIRAKMLGEPVPDFPAN